MHRFKHSTLQTIFGILALSGASAAHAITIDPTSYNAANCVGNNTCSIGIATLTAGPGGAEPAVFDEQNFAGQLGLGINYIQTGQARDPEIQGDDSSVESVLIEFASAQVVDTIELAHFYNPDEFASDPQEIALIAAANGMVFNLSLQVLDNSGGHTLLGAGGGAVATQVDTTKGLWRITNPFGDAAIDELFFTAADTVKGNDNSDYTIALVETTSARSVPEPGTLTLLGLGLIGFSLRRRLVFWSPDKKDDGTGLTVGS